VWRERGPAVESMSGATAIQCETLIVTNRVVGWVRPEDRRTDAES
jgi:hypothetical protein